MTLKFDAFYINFFVDFHFCPPHTLPPIVAVNSALYLGSPVVTRYGLDGPGFEFRWVQDFPHRPDRPWCPPSLLYTGYRVFPRGKAAGTWRWPPIPSSTEVKGRVELFIFLPLGLRGLFQGEFCSEPLPKDYTELSISPPIQMLRSASTSLMTAFFSTHSRSLIRVIFL